MKMDKKESRIKVKSLKSRKKIPRLSRLVTRDSQDFERKTALVLFRHPKLDKQQKKKSYYRIEHTPDGVRLWIVN